MSLSKRAKRGIAAFNRAKDAKYSFSYQTALDSYIKAYEELKNDTTSSKVGEMAGQQIPS